MSQSSFSSRAGRRNTNNNRSGGGGGGGGKRNYRSYGKSNSRGKKRGGHGQYIDPAKFVKEAKHIEKEVYIAENSFNDFAMHDHLKKNLELRDYTAPTKIQDKAVPLGLEGRDIIGIANTGMGKTAAFLLPLLHKLIHNKDQKALIVAPTRELALQIQDECRSFAKGAKIFDTLLIGGAPIGRQLRELNRGVQVIIGTPGRIKDHIQRGSLQLDTVTTVVLDEVDRMLDMGFINDIREILSHLPEEKQSLYFSATITPTIDSLIRTFTADPVSVMARTSETSDNVDQSVINYGESLEKLDKLHNLLVEDSVNKTLVFCETKRGVERLTKELNHRGFTSDAIHGNKSQGQRQRALKKFRDDHIAILVATDVAARGIDVDGITHVINYDVPHTYDDYTHRIGRTGRGGKSGSAVTFVANSYSR